MRRRKKKGRDPITVRSFNEMLGCLNVLWMGCTQIGFGSQSVYLFTQADSFGRQSNEYLDKRIERNKRKGLR